MRRAVHTSHYLCQRLSVQLPSLVCGIVPSVLLQNLQAQCSYRLQLEACLVPSCAASAASRGAPFSVQAVLVGTGTPRCWYRPAGTLRLHNSLFSTVPLLRGLLHLDVRPDTSIGVRPNYTVGLSKRFVNIGKPQLILIARSFPLLTHLRLHEDWQEQQLSLCDVLRLLAPLDMLAVLGVGSAIFSPGPTMDHRKPASLLSINLRCLFFPGLPQLRQQLEQCKIILSRRCSSYTAVHTALFPRRLLESASFFRLSSVSSEGVSSVPTKSNSSPEMTYTCIRHL